MKTSKAVAVFAGSFDPFTNGHSDIMHRALAIFERVIVAVAADQGSNALFSLEERIELIKKVSAQSRDRILVEGFHGLLVDYLKSQGATILVRGLRAVSDYDYEAQMALMNKSLWDEVETVFLVSREENSYISSTLVRHVASLGGDVSRYVSADVNRALRGKFKSTEVK